MALAPVAAEEEEKGKKSGIADGRAIRSVNGGSKRVEGGREVCYATAVSVTATSSHHRRFGQRSACMDGQQRGRRNGDLFYLLSQCFLSRVGMETGWSWKWPFYCGHCKSRLPSLHWANFNDGGGGGRGGVESAELAPARPRPSQHNFSHFLPAHTEEGSALPSFIHRPTTYRTAVRQSLLHLSPQLFISRLSRRKGGL